MAFWLEKDAWFSILRSGVFLSLIFLGPASDLGISQLEVKLHLGSPLISQVMYIICVSDSFLHSSGKDMYNSHLLAFMRCMI